MASTLDFYWVEHRDRPNAAWTRPDRLGTVPVGWIDAVDQLRGVADEILTTGEDDDTEHDDRLYQPSARAIECRRIIEAVELGEYDQPPFHPGDHVGGTYLRIVRADPVLHDPLAAELRYWVIHNAHGRAAATLATHSGREITGTLDWEDIEPATLQVSDRARTTIVRTDRIESFTLDPTRHSKRAS
jgi:hypothetical protein